VPFRYRDFNLTHYWHKLHFMLGKGRIPAARMECVKETSRHDTPTIQLFASEREYMRVGHVVQAVVKRRMSFVLEDQGHFLTWHRPQTIPAGPPPHND
jgi:hypothetical protein